MDMLTAFNRGLDGVYKALTPEKDDCSCRCAPAPRYVEEDAIDDSELGFFARSVLWVLKAIQFVLKVALWICFGILGFIVLAVVMR